MERNKTMAGQEVRVPEVRASKGQVLFINKTPTFNMATGTKMRPRSDWNPSVAATSLLRSARSMVSLCHKPFRESRGIRCILAASTHATTWNLTVPDGGRARTVHLRLDYGCHHRH